MPAPSRPTWLVGKPTGRRRLRRLSRRLASVGVTVPPSRLRHIAAGGQATAGELVDIAFADLAIRLKREQRRSKRVRAKRHCVHWAVVAAATVLALNALLCLGLLLFLLTKPF